MIDTLVIRTDASPQIGTGHVMRCLALAQAWQDAGGHSIFAMAIRAPVLEAWVKSEGIEVVYLSAQPGDSDDAIQTVDLARQMKASWVAIDGYHFDSDFQRIFKDAEQNVLVIDDNGHVEHYYADIVLNQNIHAEGLKYSCEPYTRLLLGTKYVLLRREFLRWRGWNREIPCVGNKVLVTLGGSDLDNVTLKVIRALRHVDVDHLEVAIVVGPTNPHLEIIRNELSLVPFAFRLLPCVENIPELMAWADVAVSAGGSTCWELAFMGLPSLILIVADNQRDVVAGLQDRGVGLSPRQWDLVDEHEISQLLRSLMRNAAKRSEMAVAGQKLVEGGGPQRIFAAMSRDDSDMASELMKGRPRR